MLAYDPTTQKFLPFGTLKDAIKSRNINDPSLPHPCCKFVFFARVEWVLLNIFHRRGI
jgi:hypothetical protein